MKSQPGPDNAYLIIGKPSTIALTEELKRMRIKYEIIENIEEDRADELDEKLREYDIVIIFSSSVSSGELIKKIRENSIIPILVFTSKNDPEMTEQLLAAGADMCIDDNTSIRVCMAYIQALLRRAQMPAILRGVVKINESLIIDLGRRVVVKDGEVIKLTNYEYNVLYHLVQSINRYVSSKDLVAKVWGKDSEDNIPALRLYIHRLRKKLGMPIDTEREFGYRINQGIQR